jgi:hypothetical protein
MLRSCQLGIKALLSFKKAETFSCYVILIIFYILYIKVVLDNKFIYFYQSLATVQYCN